jgi:hypothetical protein
VTVVAQRDQVLFAVVAGVTTEFFVMDLDMQRAAAVLAPPRIALEDLQAQFFVGVRIEFDTQLFRSKTNHDAFLLACSINAWR